MTDNSWGEIGTKEKLIERVRHQEKIWMNKGFREFFRNHEGGLLVRAINGKELKQLLKDGPRNFLFHKDTNFEFDYGYHIRLYAEYRSGTIVVSEFEEKDISLNNYDDLEKNKRQKIIPQGGSLGMCLIDFIAPVEVYNILGLNWKELRDPKYLFKDPKYLSDNEIYL